MAMPGKKTRQQRKAKKTRLGAKAKRKRDNQGTTASFPLTGDIPAVSYGFVVKPETINTEAWK